MRDTISRINRMILAIRDIRAQIYEQVEASMKKFIDEDLQSFNNLFESAGVEPISIPADTTSR